MTDIWHVFEYQDCDSPMSIYVLSPPQTKSLADWWQSIEFIENLWKLFVSFSVDNGFCKSTIAIDPSNSNQKDTHIYDYYDYHFTV